MFPPSLAVFSAFLLALYPISAAPLPPLSPLRNTSYTWPPSISSYSSSSSSTTLFVTDEYGSCSAADVYVYGGSPPFRVDLVDSETGEVVAVVGEGWDAGSHTWTPRVAQNHTVILRVTDQDGRTATDDNHRWKLRSSKNVAESSSGCTPTSLGFLTASEDVLAVLPLFSLALAAIIICVLACLYSCKRALQQRRDAASLATAVVAAPAVDSSVGPGQEMLVLRVDPTEGILVRSETATTKETMK